METYLAHIVYEHIMYGLEMPFLAFFMILNQIYIGRPPSLMPNHQYHQYTQFGPDECLLSLGDEYMTIYVD